MVKALAVTLFLGGLLLAVRVMFFGVQRRIDQERLAHRAWPLVLAAFLVASGAMLYARAGGRADAPLTGGWAALVVLLGVGAGAGAWWLVKRSAAVPSTDPEDDPRFRFQGHVARVIEPIPGRSGSGGVPTGRIAFRFDGKPYELRARWVVDGEADGGGGGGGRPDAGLSDSEVVIERVEGDVAFVEPWTVVERRL